MKLYRLLTLICLLGVCLPQLALATPWAPPGDRQLRRDIELLAAYGVIRGPVTTWPVPWSQISRGLSGAAADSLPNHVEDALQRVRARLPRSRDYRRIGYEIEAYATNDERVVRGFDGKARSEGDIRLSADRHFTSTYVRLSVSYRKDDRDGNIQFDDSYIAKAAGNWVFYGGFVDQWWGPGLDSALTLSTNARPFLKVGLMRLDPKPFRTRFLSWLGPWQLNMFAGRLESDRGDFAHPILAGMRFSFQPLRGLDLGLSRTMQLCGTGRPCGFSTWTNAFIGVGNLENTGTFNEPGNQQGTLDARYSTYIGRHDFAIYAELMGEDEDNFFIDKLSLMFGASVGGALQEGRLAWKLRAEYTDTKANRLVGKGVFNDSTYDHSIYTDGYTFRGRTIGGSLDSDTRLLTIAASMIDRRDRSYFLRYRYADVNDPGTPDHRVSGNREKLNIFEAGSDWPTRFGLFSLELRLASDQLNTPGVADFNVAFEAGWKSRF